MWGRHSGGKKMHQTKMSHTQISQPLGGGGMNSWLSTDEILIIEYDEPKQPASNRNSM